MTDRIKPDAEDFEGAVREYCTEHGIKRTARNAKMLKAKMKTDDAVLADIYRLAQAGKMIRMFGRGG